MAVACLGSISMRKRSSWQRSWAPRMAVRRTVRRSNACFKGRVVAVGAVGLNIPRKPYYDRELAFRISMSYGPGRYDREYEERGHDYPFGYVRWTEGRNIESFLDMVASGRVDVESLITHRFKIDEGERAYELITSDQPYLGVLLQYDTEREV